MKCYNNGNALKGLIYITSISDKIILLCFCTFLILTGIEPQNSVIPIAAGISFSAALEILSDRRIKIAVSSAYVLACFFVPEMIFFFPLISYDLMGGYEAVLIAVTAAAVLVNPDAIEPLVLAGIIMAVVAAALLYRFSWQYRKIKHDLISKRDELTEQSLHLKNRLSELQEQQDLNITVATLNERNRIAREIHDNVGHLLSSSILQLGAVITITKDNEQKEYLLRLKSTLDDAMTTIRSSVHDLRDDSVDLNIQLEKAVKEFTFCKAVLTNEISTELPIDMRLAILCIVKESLSNVMRHSDATEVNVSLYEHPKIYQLTVKDNGTTARNMDFSRSGNGIGLDNIRQRGEALGGIVNFSADGGFRVFVSLPRE